MTKWKPKNTEPIGNPDGGTEHICDLANGWKLFIDCTIDPPAYCLKKEAVVYLISDAVADKLRADHSA